MDTNVLFHDVENAKAVIQFEHDGLVHTNSYDVSLLMPGTKQVFEGLGMEFDEKAQNAAIAYLARNIQPLMEAKSLQPDPVGWQKPAEDEEIAVPEGGPLPKGAPAQVEPKPPVKAGAKSVVPMEPVKDDAVVMPGPAPAIDKSKVTVYEAPAAPPAPKPEKPIAVVEDAFVPPVPDEIEED